LGIINFLPKKEVTQNPGGYFKRSRSVFTGGDAAGGQGTAYVNAGNALAD